MRWKIAGEFAIALVCFAWGGSANAKAPGDQPNLPSVQTLNCGKDCKSATDPKPIEPHNASFPRFTPGDYPNDGIVVLRATVTKEGTIKDQVVVRLVGANIFAERAVEATKDWRYEPATRNGVAVDRFNWEIIVQFINNPPATGARDTVYRTFNQANSLSEEKKYAEANALLLPVLSMPRLNFYERSVVSTQLALNYMHLGDIMTADEYINDILLMGDSYLLTRQRKLLFRVATLAYGNSGQLLEAKEVYAKLNAIEPLPTDDPLVKLMQSVDARLNNAEPLLSKGRISQTSILRSWRHMLARHVVAIPQIAGKLDRLTIECGEHLIESAITGTAEWHIPNSWTDCRLDIYGEPGTAFTVAEIAE